MALEFGFGLYSKRPWGTEAFKSLNKVDEDFYHGDLPWLLVGVEIGIISKRTIPHILARLELFHKDWLVNLNTKTQKDYDIDFKDYLPRFTGYQANVITLSNADYASKYKRLLDQRVGAFTKKTARHNTTETEIIAQRVSLGLGQGKVEDKELVTA